MRSEQRSPQPRIRKAVPMQAYMKSALPFYGVQKPARDTDLALLYDCIEPNLGDGDFFIRKAIGWARATTPGPTRTRSTATSARMPTGSAR